MFQPQPTPFSTFFPTYLVDLDVHADVEVDVDDLELEPDLELELGLGGGDDGSQQGRLSSDAYAHAQAHATGFSSSNSSSSSSYSHQQQAAAEACSPTAAVGNPCPGPVGPVLGPGPTSTGGYLGGYGGAGGSAAPELALAAAGPGGLGYGGAGAPLSTLQFPFYGDIPQSRLELDFEPTLFDHNSSANGNGNANGNANDNNTTTSSLQLTPRYHFPLTTARRPAPRSTTKMDPDQSDLAAQEAAARTWQPDIDGPRVGDKTPIDAITAEYAKADPVYVAKTMALPQTYSHYRPVKGDGNCGWRAIGFCYFELLIQQGSRELVEGEKLRLSQLSDYLFNTGGYNPEMFVDFLETTFQLFQDISDNMDTPDNAFAVLNSTFNDDSSMGLLYHLRLLAASWLKGNRDQYEAWCEDGVDAYCALVIEPAEREIEELGIVLLVEVLIKPVGFILEIAYLDRSAGTEVNTHRFPESNTSIGPYVHLLYRPGHYDILYKPSPTEIQVNRSSFATATFDGGPQFPSEYDFSSLAMVPGACMVSPMSSLGQLGEPTLEYSPSPQSPWFSSPNADSSPTPPAQTLPGPSSCTAPPQALVLAQPTPPGPSVAATTPTHEIRFSRFQYEEMVANLWQEPTFHTNTFKNSHFNKAHYNNPEFTPEEYKPGVDDGEEPRVERSSRKRSHGRGGPHSPDDRGDAKTRKEK